jgi:hypothetical protein
MFVLTQTFNCDWGDIINESIICHLENIKFWDIEVNQYNFSAVKWNLGKKLKMKLIFIGSVVQFFWHFKMLSI